MIYNVISDCALSCNVGKINDKMFIENLKKKQAHAQQRKQSKNK